MVRTGIVEHDVTHHHQELLALAAEAPGERVLPCHVHKPLAHPLPKLPLSGPELVVVGAHDPRGLLGASFGWR